MQGVFIVSIRPDDSSMMWSTRRSTCAVRPQYLSISRSNDSPRLLLSGLRVALISSMDLTLTHSPGWRSSLSSGLFSAVPWMKG